VNLHDLLRELDFQNHAIEYASAHHFATPREFWKRTEYSHLLLELVGGLVEYGCLDIRTMVLCAAGAAEQTLAYVPWGIMAPRNAVYAAKHWALDPKASWWDLYKVLPGVSRSIPVNLSTAEAFATAAAAQCLRSAIFAANPEVPIGAVAEAHLAVAYARSAIGTYLDRRKEYRDAPYSEQVRLASLEQARAIREAVSWETVEPGIAAFGAYIASL